MQWEQRLLAFFDDLEQQAEGLALAERDSEVAELSRAEYAQVDLVARLHASTSREVALGVVGSGVVSGTLSRVGWDWCLVGAGQQEWVVRLGAVTYARGLSERAVGEAARPLAARLGIGSALRGLAEAQAPVTVRRTDGGTWTGPIGRVGADFLEVMAGHDSVPPRRDVAGLVLVPFAAIASVGSR